MLSAYPACFIREENEYTVVFPDLNWLSTCGATLDEAFAMAVDCLAGYIYTSQLEHEKIPAPSSVQDIDTNKIVRELEITASEAFTNIITVDVKEYAKVHFEKSVKKTLSIPAWLNRAALERGINFSQTLQEALLKKIKQ